MRPAPRLYGPPKYAGPVFTGEVADGETGEVILKLDGVPIEEAWDRAARRAEEVFGIKLRRHRWVALPYMASTIVLGAWELLMLTGFRP